MGEKKIIQKGLSDPSAPFYRWSVMQGLLNIIIREEKQEHRCEEEKSLRVLKHRE